MSRATSRPTQPFLRAHRVHRPAPRGARDAGPHHHLREFTFDPASTGITTPVGRVLAGRRGVCRDFAHLQIAGLRALGLAARYVSGYILTTPPPGQPRLAGAAAARIVSAQR